MVNRIRRVTKATAIIVVAVPLMMGGCAGISSAFNPEFLQALGTTASAASIPGEAPAVLVVVENNTGRPIEFRAAWRDSNDEAAERTGRLASGNSSGEVLVCPIPEITMGDIGNLGATGAIVLLGDGSSADAFIEVEPFAVVLEEGVHYECGDEVRFSVENSAATLSGYRIFATVTHAGVQSSASAN